MSATRPPVTATLLISYKCCVCVIECLRRVLLHSEYMSLCSLAAIFVYCFVTRISYRPVQGIATNWRAACPAGSGRGFSKIASWCEEKFSFSPTGPLIIVNLFTFFNIIKTLTNYESRFLDFERGESCWFYINVFFCFFFVCVKMWKNARTRLRSGYIKLCF